MTAQALATKPTRLNALQHRHAVLSDQIEQEQKSPSSTDFFLRQLKKQKLALKEEMEGIRESGAASA